MNRWIIDSIRSDDETLLRSARNLLVIVIASSTVTATAGLVHFLDGNLVRGLSATLCAVPLALAAVILRKTGRVDLALHYVCALIATGVILGPFVSNESTPLYVGLITLPMASILVGGTIPGLIWTGLITGFLAACALGLPYRGDDQYLAWYLVLITLAASTAMILSERARERTLALVVAALDKAEKAIRIRDSAEQAMRETQTKFSSAFMNAPSISAIVAADTGELLDINESFVRILGYSQEDIAGRNPIEIGVWPRSPQTTEFFDRLDRYGAVNRLEVPMCTRSGDLIWVEISSEKLEFKGRECIISQAVDITDRKRNDEELAEHRRKLELRYEERGEQLKASLSKLRESERLATVGTLAAGIAHQINNPIGGIVAASEFALSGGDGGNSETIPRAELQEALTTSLKEARRCGRIVKSILTFSRDEPTPKLVEDLNPVVRRASELARPHVEELGGTLIVETSSEAIPALMSPIDIEQIVLNLVRNAAESMEGGAQVCVSTIHLGDRAEFAVTDNGRGIANENRSRVFDPFFTTRLSRGGSGLGLSIVHGMIGEHRWSIDIETAPQGGTCFRIGLPLGLAEPA
ncbi:MAG: PAS domain S-box-containing protein [Myxococcota bacterium]|jgi:PAS domain S-box-containing protein